MVVVEGGFPEYSLLFLVDAVFVVQILVAVAVFVDVVLVVVVVVLVV